MDWLIEYWDPRSLHIGNRDELKLLTSNDQWKSVRALRALRGVLNRWYPRAPTYNPIKVWIVVLMISDLARARSWRLRTVMRQWFVSSVQSVWWLTGSTLLKSMKCLCARAPKISAFGREQLLPRSGDPLREQPTSPHHNTKGLVF
jgi:hypothetical protein